MQEKEKEQNSKKDLKQSIEELQSILSSIEDQLRVLEEMGFNDENVKKVISSLSHDQKEYLDSINKSIERVEREQMKNFVKAGSSENKIKKKKDRCIIPI